MNLKLEQLKSQTEIKEFQANEDNLLWNRMKANTQQNEDVMRNTKTLLRMTKVK